jgi:hypothetical protein
MQLQQTQTLIQTLLTEIRENSSDQASLAADLRNLRLNVDTLSGIIRGGDGNSKPLVLEVEMMKHADIHLDKRMTSIVEDLEDQLVSLGRNLSSSSERFQGALDAQRITFEAKLELSDKLRREYETARLQAEVATNNDIRLDGRARFQVWATIIIALLALIGSTLTLILK